MDRDPDCLFCKIVAGEIPADKVYEDEACVAFRDINPQAPTHILVVPREHIARLDAVQESHRALLGHLLERVAHLAREQGLADEGFRTVVNCGASAGQEVFHIHVHLLGGRTFRWPPG